MKPRFQLQYGADFFYLPGTPVKGTIYQEHQYPNLSYQYNIEYFPLLFGAKALFKKQYKRYAFTLNGAIGPNFIRLYHYREHPLNTYSIPMNSFSNRNTTTFAAMVGCGFQLLNVFGKSPVEFGYRFLYLGNSQLPINNDQILNSLKTGSNFANAFVISLII